MIHFHSRVCGYLIIDFDCPLVNLLTLILIYDFNFEESLILVILPVLKLFYPLVILVC